eukprot:3530326-Pyramimonas_sp.AAC.1
MLLMEGMDLLVARYPRVDWKLYIDDLRAQQRGRQRALVDDAHEVAAAASGQFASVGLAFSMGKEGKYHQLASAPWLRSALKPVMARQGIKVQRAGIYPGVDMP